MIQWIQCWGARFISLGLALLLVAGWSMGMQQSAFARVMQETLSTGVILDKSLRTIKDVNGYSWQAIAFKNTYEDHSDRVYLRLVGFPGVISVDRSTPMIVTIPSGQTAMLHDVSSLIFKDGLPVQPNVAQYELNDVLAQIQASMPLRLTLPVITRSDESTSGGRPTPVSEIGQLELSIPSAVVDEWRIVANQSRNKSDRI